MCQQCVKLNNMTKKYLQEVWSFYKDPELMFALTLLFTIFAISLFGPLLLSIVLKWYWYLLLYYVTVPMFIAFVNVCCDTTVKAMTRKAVYNRIMGEQ